MDGEGRKEGLCLPGICSLVIEYERNIIVCEKEQYGYG